MNKRRLSGWIDALLWLCAIVGAITWGYFFVNDNGDRCPQGRMPWSCITWVTIDRYESQLDADLAIGTPQQEVEAYLRREDVPFVERFDSGSGLQALKVEKSLPGCCQSKVWITFAFGPGGDLTEIRVERSMVFL